MTIGNNIKKLRTAQGLTQDQLAERLFVTRQTISSWERSASHPSLEQLEAIAAALGEDVMTLLYGPKPKYRPSRKRVILAVVLIALAVIALVLGAVLPLQVEGWVMRHRPGWLFYMVAFRLVEWAWASLERPLCAGRKGKGKAAVFDRGAGVSAGQSGPFCLDSPGALPLPHLCVLDVQL